MGPDRHIVAPTASNVNGNYNAAGSYGITGLPTLTIKAATAPSIVADSLNENRGVILLVYVAGAADDEEMLANFNAVKAKYAAQASFFSFEAADISQLGDLLDQLRVSAPPILAVIRPDGTVYQSTRLDRRAGHGPGRRQRPQSSRRSPARPPVWAPACTLEMLPPPRHGSRCRHRFAGVCACGAHALC